jgi:superoxide dismutase, Fe-Mn family
MVTLPTLSYSFDALEPYIDARTMELHLTKHHQTYIDTFNGVIKDYPEYAAKPVEELIKNLAEVPEAIRGVVRNHGGGHVNHTFFWQAMGPQRGGEPVGTLRTEIEKKFGTVTAFQEKMSAAAKSVFGSGWAWLVVDATGSLALQTTANQDSPLSVGAMPITGLDVWEHAYYLKYQNRRVDYIAAWWHVVDWQRAEELFAAVR